MEEGATFVDIVEYVDTLNNSLSRRREGGMDLLTGYVYQNNLCIVGKGLAVIWYCPFREALISKFTVA